jgi:molybdopterin synthase sulfur carrier subunit
MVTVQLGGPLKSAAGGRSSFEVEARTIRELLDRLEEAYPELEDVLEQGVAVAIDGTIYRDAWFQPIPEGSEVFLLPRMAGG